MVPRRGTVTYRKALGQVIRGRRKELDLSQEEIGFRAEIDRTYLTGLEAGTRNPTLDTILRVAKALDAKPSRLLAEAEASMARKRKN